MVDRQLGRYKLIGILGKGAMGIVYEAIDPQLERRVAVKTMRIADISPDQAANYERRFLTEARSAARLRHPGIVSVFDWGREEDVTYLVMEKVKGVNLRNCLDAGVRFSASGAAAILRQVLSALAHAHEQKIVHRDIKPENILLDAEGLVRLTDFGIAKMQDGADNGTLVSGMAIGTPRYMSPEQVQGKEVDGRSDLFSAGVLLYELLAGRSPFQGDSALALVDAILRDSPPPLVADGVAQSPVWDKLLAKALAKRAENRFQRAEAFLAALSHAASSEGDGASTDNSGNPDHHLSTMLRLGSGELLDQLFSSMEGGSSSPKSNAGVQASDAATGSQALKPDSRADSKLSATTNSTFMFAVGSKVWVGLVVIMLIASVWLFTRQEGGSGQQSEAKKMPDEMIIESTPQPNTSKVGSSPVQPHPGSPVAGGRATQGQPKATVSPASVADAKPSKPKEASAAPSGINSAKPIAPVSPTPPVAATPGKCSRLLEKASAGEPLSDTEQKEMVTLCR